MSPYWMMPKHLQETEIHNAHSTPTWQSYEEILELQSQNTEKKKNVKEEVNFS